MYSKNGSFMCDWAEENPNVLKILNALDGFPGGITSKALSQALDENLSEFCFFTLFGFERLGIVEQISGKWRLLSPGLGKAIAEVMKIDKKQERLARDFEARRALRGVAPTLTLTAKR